MGPLFKRKLITVLIDKDRRKKNLTLTDAGKKLCEAGLVHWKNAQSAIEKSFGKTEVKTLLHLQMIDF